MKKIIIENTLTIIYALIIALFIRSLLIQPFYIPSSSMEPNLLVGDRLFVTKYTYGFSKHSFPFSPPIFKGRILNNNPERGDVIVFKTPADNRTDYIKRLIGLPGDKIQFIDGNLFLNNLEIFKDLNSKKESVFCGDSKVNSNFFTEKLPSGTKFNTAYFSNFTLQNTDLFEVPKNHYFFLGDNRDCSKDSRFLSSVGYVHRDNLVGKARFIFFSSDSKKGSIFEIWRWGELIRFDRFFKKIN